MSENNSLKVAIIGGGISGVFAAIRIKEKNPDYVVSIFERNDKLLKKLYATGNGKCNFANTGVLKGKYRNEELALNIIEQFNCDKIRDYFQSIGVVSKTVGKLVYPYSESAETVANALLKRVNQLDIRVYLSEEIIDYTDSSVLTNTSEYKCDKIVFSCGGKSAPQLGTNGGLFSILEKHGYKIKQPYPSLCPIKINENVKRLDGLRAKVNTRLFDETHLIHEEEGELLFKKDGLSGMVIFNQTFFINSLNNKEHVSIHIDFAKDINGNYPYESLLHPDLAEYFYKNNLNIHDVTFTFKDFYPYENSQVTAGGVEIDQIHEDLSSQKENNVYFVGEVLDIDATCGGFNIMWALASAERVANAIAGDY